MAEGWTIVRSVNLIANERFLKLIENIHHGVSFDYFNQFTAHNFVSKSDFGRVVETRT